jgi:outer membrane protein OmpA-like peptidoglycan-associated protein/tetratricopeptide (TPR) repeat protein
MKKIFIIVGAFFVSNIYAQDIEFKAGNFKDKKDEFKNALAHFEKGDDFLELGNESIYTVNSPGNNFTAAIQEYQYAFKFNPNSAELNFKMGNAYLYTNEKYKALFYLIKAEKLNPEVDTFLDFYLGMAQQLDMDFASALKHYEKFESATKSKHVETLGKMLEKRKTECKNGTTLAASPIRAWIDNVDNINSPEDDYSPCISTDGGTIMFTSRRENGHKADEVGVYDGDIYITEISNLGKWSKPKNVGEPLSTDNDETSTMLSYNGTKLLVFKTEGEDYNVYESNLEGSKWSAPEKLHRSLNTIVNQTHATYNFNDRKIYFISDKQVGSSSKGTDIYFCGRMNGEKGEFGAAQPIGKEVNTSFNEGSVYMHPDGETMYFSSEGHNSMGGYDIFMSEKKQGIWQIPVNMGYPINTPYDDHFFAATASGKYAYISSNREGGKGGLDIYKVTFWGNPKELIIDTEDYLLASIANPIQDVKIESTVKVNKKSLTVFKGVTIDAIENKAVEAKMEIIDNSTGQKMETFITNSATGKFLLSLNAGRNYGISVQADGYLFHSENFDIPSQSSFSMVNKEIKLKNIKVGSKIALRNVFFDVGKSTVKDESNTELDRLVKLMKDVPGLKIELSGHTDNTGSESLNRKLSQDRATAVVDYLKAKGIVAARLSAKGYGSSEPIANNASSEGRQENRRTEFKITNN